MSAADWAARYIEKYGLALVSIPPGHKAPLDHGWNKPGGYITDVLGARQRWGGQPGHGIGAVLGPSGLCSLDEDSPEHAEPVLASLGIAMPEVRAVTPTIIGNPSRSRVMFAAPPGVVLGRKTLVWPAKDQGGKSVTLFELRAGDIQDVLPPTVHPETGQPYHWLTPPNSEFPPLPPALLELWENWDSYKPELEAMCPWAKTAWRPLPARRSNGARPNVIAEFNRAHTVEVMLEEHGYVRRGNRWMSPTSSSGLAGVVVLDGRVYSHHASDPLGDGHAHDAFDMYRVLDHGGDMRGAVKALGLRRPNGGLPPGDARHRAPTVPGAETVRRRVSDITAKPIRWLWKGRITRGKVTVIAGHPGLGKSQATLSMAAIVTIGGAWPVDRSRCERGAVVILSAEDDAADTIRPRLEASGADLERVWILDAVRETGKDGTPIKRTFNLTEDIGRLKATIEEIGDVALIVIDPITAYLGRVDSHNNAEVRGVLAPLAEMAAEVGAAVVCVSHLNKVSGGTEAAMLRVMGSVGFVGAARGAYLIAKDPDDEDRRLFLPMKNNLAKDLGGLAFRVVGRDLDGGIETSCVEWGSEIVVMSAEAALAPVPAVDPDDAEEAKEDRSAVRAAEEWLRDLLKDGPVNVEEVQENAKAARVGSWRTVERAKHRLGAKSIRPVFGGPYRWALPEHCAPLHSGSDGGHGNTTPLKPSCSAGSTHARQAQNDSPHTTPLKPSCSAGSTHARQATEPLADHGVQGSNLAVVRVPGGAERGAQGGGGVQGSNLAVVRVPGGSDLHARQDSQSVGEDHVPDPWDEPSDSGGDGDQKEVEV